MAWWAAMIGLAVDAVAGMLNVLCGDQSWFMPALLGAFGFGTVAFLLSGGTPKRPDR